MRGHDSLPDQQSPLRTVPDNSGCTKLAQESHILRSQQSQPGEKPQIEEDVFARNHEGVSARGSVIRRLSGGGDGQVGNQLVDRPGAVEKPDKVAGDWIVQRYKSVTEVSEQRAILQLFPHKKAGLRPVALCLRPPPETPGRGGSCSVDRMRCRLGAP